MKKTAAVVLSAAMMLTACGSASTTETTAAGSQAAGSEAASSAEETKAASGDAQKLVLSTYGLSEDISEEEVYTPFENEFSCEIVTETGGTNDRYTKLAADPNSTIDVIELSQAMTAKGTDEGLFDTIDLSKIPNAEKLIPAAKEIAEAGQGVPYTINSIGTSTTRSLQDLNSQALMTFGTSALQAWFLSRRSQQHSDRLWFTLQATTQALT